MRKKRTKNAPYRSLFGQMLAHQVLGSSTTPARGLEGWSVLKILILICPIAVDHEHCDRDTAVDIIRLMQVSSPQQCGFMGQTMLAPTSLVPEPDKQYVKILCVRVHGETVALAKP